MKLTRQEILQGKYLYPEDFIPLRSTHHFEQRLKERSLSLECIPTQVRITRNNIHSAKSKDGQKLSSVVVRIDYNSYKNLFLVFSPWDGALKSLWFKEKAGYVRFKQSCQKGGGQAVRNDQLSTSVGKSS